MGLGWTDPHYDLLDELYADALSRQSAAETVRKHNLIEAAMRATGRGAGSCSLQFGNMTAARSELGLPTLRAIGPMRNRALKLVRFLQGKHCPAP